MKKFLVVLLIFGNLMLGMTACSTYDEMDDYSDFEVSSGEFIEGSSNFGNSQNNTVDNYQQNANNVIQQDEQKEPISLTTDNINDYLIFSLTENDVTVEETFDKERGTGNLTLKTSPKMSGEFQNVSITFSFETSSSGWGTMQNCSIDLPFDGKSENNFNIYSYVEDNVSSSPSYHAVVTSVSGSFVE